MSYLYPKRKSLPPIQIVLLLAAGAAAGLTAAYLLLAPRVVSVSPESNQRTGAYAAVEIRFSAAMNPDCTAGHFSVEPAVAGDLSVQGGTLRFTPKDPWPAGTVVRLSIRAGACSARGLPLRTGRTWNFSPTLSRVAFIPSGAADNRLMAVAVDGGDPATLAQLPDPIRSFDISRRGDFAVLAAGPSAGTGRLWYAWLDGRPAELLLDCGADSCDDPAISPDGSFVAYVRTASATGTGAAGTSVELLAVAGGQVQTVSPAGHTAGNPVWSAQGWLSYYDESRQAIVIDDLAGGETAVPNAGGGSWAWLPDGSAVVFPEFFVDESPTEGISSRIYSRLTIVEVETNERLNLSGSDLLEDSSPAVSPDGRWLAFSRNFFDSRWTPGRQLWLMDLGDSSLRKLTETPDYSHTSIRWSPDGARLAFMLFHETVPEDPPEIWCLDADGSDPQRLVVGGFLPRWLP